MTISTTPLPLEDRLVNVGRVLLETVADELDNPPSLRYLTGPTPAVENCENCDGQLTVGLNRLLPGFPARPDMQPNQRAAGPFPAPALTVMTAEWHVELWRCVDVEEVNTTEIQDAAGVAWIRDCATMKRAVTKLSVPASQGIPQRLPGASAALLMEVSPIGQPEGGSRGLRAVVQISTG